MRLVLLFFGAIAACTPFDAGTTGNEPSDASSPAPGDGGPQTPPSPSSFCSGSSVFCDDFEATALDSNWRSAVVAPTSLVMLDASHFKKEKQAVRSHLDANTDGARVRAQLRRSVPSPTGSGRFSVSVQCDPWGWSGTNPAALLGVHIDDATGIEIQLTAGALKGYLLGKGLGTDNQVRLHPPLEWLNVAIDFDFPHNKAQILIDGTPSSPALADDGFDFGVTNASTIELRVGLDAEAVFAEQNCWFDNVRLDPLP